MLRCSHSFLDLTVDFHSTKPLISILHHCKNLWAGFMELLKGRNWKVSSLLKWLPVTIKRSRHLTQELWIQFLPNLYWVCPLYIHHCQVCTPPPPPFRKQVIKLIAVTLHPVHSIFKLLPSDRRYKSVCVKTARHTDSSQRPASLWWTCLLKELFILHYETTQIIKHLFLFPSSTVLQIPVCC